MTNHHEELESLWFEWESGLATEQQFFRLRHLLESDEAARQHFLDLQVVSSALQLEGLEVEDVGVPLISDFPRPDHVRQDDDRPRWKTAVGSFVAGIALCCCLVAATFWAVTGDSSSEGQQPKIASRSQTTSRGIAILTKTANARWAPDCDFERGEALQPGLLKLESGAAQVEFLCGATVIIEGPAELNLISAKEARVHKGRLRANVPPAARGFLLRVDELEVIDLGTEFGLSVGDHETQLDVFDGEVELHKANTTRLVKAGESVIHTSSGSLESSGRGPAYLDFQELQQRSESASSQKRVQSTQFVNQLKSDKRLLAFYSFNIASIDGRRLQNEAVPINRELDAAIVGTQTAFGRWDDHQALEFKQPADRVRMQISGQQTAITLSAWVKIDSLDRAFNSLFLTDGYDKGEPHWQILESGQLYFSVRPKAKRESGKPDFKVVSPPFFHPGLQGKWIHLAVSCDLKSRTVMHYLNGQVISRQQVPADQLPDSIQIGTASIGNWAAPTLPEEGFAIRNLNGSIDEFAIFADALSEHEIQEIFEYGKP